MNRNLFGVLNDSDPGDAESGSNTNCTSKRTEKDRVYKGKNHRVCNKGNFQLFV